MQRLKGEERWRIDYEGKRDSSRRGICRFYWENMYTLKERAFKQCFCHFTVAELFQCGAAQQYFITTHLHELALYLLIYYSFSFLSLYLVLLKDQSIKDHQKNK